MKRKYNKNEITYALIIIVTIIVYLVIHLYCNGLKNDIYKENSEYANNLNKQPINNIISMEKKNDFDEIESISFAQESYSVKIDGERRLIPIIKPSSLSNANLTWTSSDPTIATVDENGVVKGLKEGTVTITVRTPNGKEATCIVNVVKDDIKIDKIILKSDKKTIKVGEIIQIIAITKPENATESELIWENSDPSIATVDENGIVKGITPGTTTITVKTTDGKVTAKIVITVIPATGPTPEGIIFEYDYDEGNYIYLINQFPIVDEIGKSLQGEKHTQDFKIKFNKKATGVKYIITMEKLDGSDLDDNWVKQFLVNDGADVENCYRANKRVKTFDEYAMYKNNPKERILYEGTITSSEAARGYKDFTYRMWVSEDLQLNNSDYLSQTKTYKTRINVYAFE